MSRKETWLSEVERQIWDYQAAGSIPVSPISSNLENHTNMKKESMSASVEVPFEQLQTYTSSVLSKLSSCQEKLATTQEK